MEIFGNCRKYGISLWQCPSFLFFIMGIFIVFVSLTLYFIGTKFIQTPEIVALIVLSIAAILLIISFIITSSFERLAEANRLKSEFISIASHQLRTPISNFKWTLELFFSGKLGKISEKQVEYLKILKENSERMIEMLKDLLVVSKLETASFPLKKEKFSLVELTKNVVNHFKNLASAYNVKIRTFFQENLPQTFASKEQIKLVIENLLENAIFYTKGKGQVDIKIEKRGKMLYFEIRDNGIGIPKEDQKFIFEKFFRASNVSKYQTRGTGLGLFISKKIIQRSGGKIGFESRENKGSKFWFYLPIK
jgi:signal transduction histidine kinase